MKVLMFGWEYPPHISGGLGTACFGLTRGLAAIEGIDLTFVLPKVYGDEENHGMHMIGAGDVELSHEIILNQMEIEKRQFYEFNQMVYAYTTPEQYHKMFEEQKKKFISSHENKSFGKLVFSGKYGSTLYEEISRYGVVSSVIAQKQEFDVIHAHDWLTYPAGIEAKKCSGKPLIVHVHATEFDRSGENQVNTKVYDIEKKGMEFADKVITVSDFTRDIVVNKYKIDPHKVITIHNGIEPVRDLNINAFRRKNVNEHVVTFLGRITKQKGPEYFIQAAYKVLQKMKNVRFVMAGSGDMLESMVKLVGRLKIADKFHFTGFLKGADVYKMYSLSDLYVMPSVSEPFGISPLEAIQSDLPVIISKQSGVSEVITNALKVDFWDADAMADAIYGILNYRSLSQFLKVKSKKELDRLTWENAASKVKEVYYNVA
jgi:glycosyltransferase involved in cell wall biosynthesis